MDQFAWLFWIILGTILIIAEIFTLGFVLFWFGIGALAAALFGFLGFGFGIQFLVFAVVSIGLTMMSRTIFSNYFPNDEKDLIKTGIDTLPGQIGTVSSSSKGVLNEASVKVYGSIWRAFPADANSILEEGEKVEVVRVEGASVYVRKADAKRQLPDWRNDD